MRQLLVMSARNRHTGDTAMNSKSSRSHSVAIITIEEQDHVMADHAQQDAAQTSTGHAAELGNVTRMANGESLLFAKCL